MGESQTQTLLGIKQQLNLDTLLHYSHTDRVSPTVTPALSLSRSDRGSGRYGSRLAGCMRRMCWIFDDRRGELKELRGGRRRRRLLGWRQSRLGCHGVARVLSGPSVRHCVAAAACGQFLMDTRDAKQKRAPAAWAAALAINVRRDAGTTRKWYWWVAEGGFSPWVLTGRLAHCCISRGKLLWGFAARAKNSRAPPDRAGAGSGENWFRLTISRNCH